MKAFRAVLALVLFVGAVTMSSAQTFPTPSSSLQLLKVKMEQIGNTRPAVKHSQVTTLTPALVLATYRYGFYKHTAYKIKNGSSVDAAIDDAYSTLSARGQAALNAANTLRQEVIDYLTKS